MDYRANNRDDLESLVRDINNLSIGNKAEFMAFCYVHSLMVTRNIFIKFLFRIISFVKGKTRGILTVMLILSERNPDIIETMINQTTDHILKGKDREDKDSVGGFSQREIDMLVQYLQKLR